MVAMNLPSPDEMRRMQQAAEQFQKLSRTAEFKQMQQLVAHPERAMRMQEQVNEMLRSPLVQALMNGTLVLPNGSRLVRRNIVDTGASITDEVSVVVSRPATAVAAAPAPTILIDPGHGSIPRPPLTLGTYSAVFAIAVEGFFAHFKLAQQDGQDQALIVVLVIALYIAGATWVNDTRDD
jgi:hypothetical protein